MAAFCRDKASVLSCDIVLVAIVSHDAGMTDGNDAVKMARASAAAAAAAAADVVYSRRLCLITSISTVIVWDTIETKIM